MKAQRIDKVELCVGERFETFEIDHAERILRMENNGGWTLPSDSKFQFSKDNGIIVRADKGTGSKPGENTGT
jgi:hypothetical protein